MEHVLVVDDDRLVGELLGQVLQDEGYTAHVAGVLSAPSSRWSSTGRMS